MLIVYFFARLIIKHSVNLDATIEEENWRIIKHNSYLDPSIMRLEAYYNTIPINVSTPLSRL